MSPRAEAPALPVPPATGRRREVFGIPVDALTMSQAVGRCVATVEHGGYLAVGMLNAAKVVAMRRDAVLRRAVSGCGMVLADGQSVVWASRVLGSPLPERVAGIDLFEQLLGEASRRGYRVYFLGARPDTLARLLAEVRWRYPRLDVAGSRDGYFPPGQEAAVAAGIRRSAPDLLFVGMSSPRKELFLSQWGPRTGAAVTHGVGGSFDVLAGVTRRAPVWCQNHGLEWLYRAWQEPARLGRRYLATNGRFMALLARELMRRRPGTGGALEISPPAGLPAQPEPSRREGAP